MVLTPAIAPKDRSSGVATVDAITSATPLVAPVADIRNLLLGNIAGAIGETCKIAILLGLVYLLIRGVIRWQIPVCMLGTVALMSWILGKDPLTAVLSGGVLFGAVFMATDYVTTPMLKVGRPSSAWAPVSSWC